MPQDLALPPHDDAVARDEFGDAADARALARECNEYFARLTADRPTRWGWFATLPLPDVDGALAEITYAFDTLKADGACLMTSYMGKYLGDPVFAPVMDELNRRRAVVYTHPFRGESMVNLLPDGRALGITLTTETTLTIASVLSSGTVARCPDIRFIWSHGGGTMPYSRSPGRTRSCQTRESRRSAALFAACR